MFNKIKGFLVTKKGKVLSLSAALLAVGAVSMGTVAVIYSNKGNDTIQEDEIATTANASVLPFDIVDSAFEVTVDEDENSKYVLSYYLDLKVSESSGYNRLDKSSAIWIDLSLEDPDNEIHYLGEAVSVNGQTYSYIVGDKNGNSTSGFVGEGETIDNRGYADVKATTTNGIDVSRLNQQNTPVMYIYDPTDPTIFNGCPASVEGCVVAGTPAGQDDVATPYYITPYSGVTPGAQYTWSFDTFVFDNASATNITDSSAKINFETSQMSDKDDNAASGDLTYLTPQVLQYSVKEKSTGNTIIPYSTSTIIDIGDDHGHDWENGSFNITGLNAGTTYIVEFRIDYKYVQAETVEFKTTGVANNATTNDSMVSNITTNSATVSYVMSITNPATLTVQYRYGIDANGNGSLETSESVGSSSNNGWKDVPTNESTMVNNGVYSVNLTGLTANSNYIFEIRDNTTESTTSNGVTSAHFTTKADNASVSAASISYSAPNTNGDVASATVSYTLYKGSFSSVNVRYRFYRSDIGSSTASWTTLPSVSTSGVNTFTVNNETTASSSSLKSNTSYTVDVQVDTDNDGNWTDETTYTSATEETATVGNTISAEDVSAITTSTARITYNYNYVDVLNQTVEYRYGADDDNDGVLDDSEVDQTWAQDGHGAWTQDGTSSFLITGLDSNTKYNYELRIAQDPTKVDSGTFTTLATESVITGSSATATTNSVTLEYDVVINDYSNADVQYRIYETAFPPEDENTYKWTDATDVITTSGTYDEVITVDSKGNNIKPGTSYTMDVRISNDGINWSGVTTTSVTTTSQAPALTNYTAQAVTGSYDTINISYTIALNSYSNVTVEYRYNDGTGWSAWNTESNGSITSSGTYSFNFYGKSNTTYDFELRVNYGAGLTTTPVAINDISTNRRTAEISDLTVLATTSSGVRFQYNFTQYNSLLTDVQYKIYAVDTSSSAETAWVQTTATPGLNVINTDQANIDGDTDLESIAANGSGQEYVIEISTVENPTNVLSTTFVAEDDATISNLSVNPGTDNATFTFDITNGTSTPAVVDYEYKLEEEGTTVGTWSYGQRLVAGNTTVTETISLGSGSTDINFNDALKSDTNYTFEVYVTDSLIANGDNIITFTTDMVYGYTSNEVVTVGSYDGTGTNNDIMVEYDLVLNDSEKLIYYSTDYDGTNIDNATWYVDVNAAEGSNTLYIYNLPTGTDSVSIWLEDAGTRGAGITTVTFPPIS